MQEKNYTSEGRYVPQELQDQFSDTTIIKSDTYGGERLFGIRKDGVRIPLDWDVMIGPVEEQFGVLAPRCSDDEEKKYKNNPDLWKAHQENAWLRTQLHSSTERIREQNAVIQRHGAAIEELRAELRALREGRPVAPAAVGVSAPAGTPAAAPGAARAPRWDGNPPAPAAAAEGAAPPPAATPGAEGEPRRGFWSRQKDKLYYGPAARHTNRRVVEESVPAGGATVVDERPVGAVATETEIIDEEERRSRLGLIAGGIATGAVLVGGIWLLDTLFKRHGGPGIEYLPNNPKINDIQTTVHNNNGLLRDNHSMLKDITPKVNQDHPLIEKMSHKIDRLMGVVRELKRDEAQEAAAAKFANFHPDSFFGRTPHETVSNAFNVVRDNNIRVHGLTGHKINLIAHYMEQHHWHMASGVDANHNQHIVDVASDWVDGRTSNASASGEQGFQLANGSSVNAWHHFMHVARHYGVTFKVRT
jgi:hypothetical protein